jgi:hypothetical protein
VTNPPHSTNRAPTLSGHEMSVANALLRVFTPLTVEQRARVIAMLSIRFGMVRSRRRRKPSITTLVKRAEKTGKSVISITTPDGTTINFGESTKSENALDQWIAKHARSSERH